MIEVRGVLISCETLVISSVRKRSDFMRSPTARFMPSVMELRSSPCSLNGPRSLEVSTLQSSSPLAMRCPASRSCFIDSSAYSVASTSTARSMNQPKSCFPGLVPAMAIHRNSTKRIAAMMSTARGNMGMAFSPSLKV